MSEAKRKQPNNYLQNLEARAEVSFQALLDEILTVLGGISPFAGNVLAKRKVQQALTQTRYEERMRQTIETVSLASANEALGPLSIAQADKYIRWRMHEVYDGVTLSQTLRHNAAQTAEILTDTIRAQLKNGGTWTQLAQKIKRHDKVSDISVTLAELAKAGKKMNVNPQEINRLVGKAQRYINTLSPNDAPTPYLKSAYQKLIDAVEKGAGEAAINKALGQAMDSKVRYNAERISRTEIARAHNEAFRARYDNDPDVTGYQWVLSSRHHITDECTMIRELDSGAGPGVYLKKYCPQIPIHPHCMCMLLPYTGEPPEKTTFKTFKDYLEKQPDDKRADIIGKANAQSPVLYRRGLEKRGINPDRPGEPRRIPGELLAPGLGEPIGDKGQAELGDFDGAAAKAHFLGTIRQANGTDTHVKNMNLYAQTTEYREDKNLKVPFTYRPGDDIIYFNPIHPNFDKYDFDTARAHELSHRMDDLQYHSTDNKAFVDAIESATKKLANVAHEILPMFEAGGEYMDDMALSDIMSALSKGTLEVPIGHTAEYWNNKYAVVREIFANISTMDVLSRPSMRVVEKYFLELLYAYRGLIK